MIHIDESQLPKANALMPLLPFLTCSSERVHGTRSPVGRKYKAQLIVWNVVQEMATILGNPDYEEVEHPDNETNKEANGFPTVVKMM
jgi:hypothetical protein